MPATTIRCPECGGEMNLHAVKPSEPASREEAARADPVLGLVLDEMHSCPQCGASATRPLVSS